MFNLGLLSSLTASVDDIGDGHGEGDRDDDEEEEEDAEELDIALVECWEEFDDIDEVDIGDGGELYDDNQLVVEEVS